MKLEFLWKDSDSSTWLRALSLPVLPWARPFLPVLGLPSALVEQPDIWTPIYARAVVAHQTRRQAKNWAVGVPGGRGDLMRQIVVKALFELAEQLGQDVAVELERWVRRHFLCQEVRSAMFAWQLVLRNACRPPNSRSDQIPPPAVLAPILPEIASLVSFDRINEINTMLQQVAPPPPYEQIPYEKMEKCYEATLIYRAFNQALTIRALQTIAGRLNETERKEVVAWAQAQAEAMRPLPKPERLRGDKYLRTQPPCSDIPSVFSFPPLDENRSDL